MPYGLNSGVAGANGSDAALNGVNILDLAVGTTTANTARIGMAGTNCGLQAEGISQPVTATVTFASPMRNLNFWVHNMTEQTKGWDNRITIIATNAAGQQVPITWGTQNGLPLVKENRRDGGGKDLGRVNGAEVQNAFQVKIEGPIMSLKFVFDKDNTWATCGLFDVSDMSFDTLIVDGHVKGPDLAATDLIDAPYLGNSMRGHIQNKDAVVVGAKTVNTNLLCALKDNDPLAFNRVDSQAITLGASKIQAGTVTFFGDGTLAFSQIESVAFRSAVDGTLGNGTTKAGFTYALNDRLDGTEELNDTFFAYTGTDTIPGGAILDDAGQENRAGGDDAIVSASRTASPGTNNDTLDQSDADSPPIVYGVGNTDVGTVIFHNGRAQSFWEIANVAFAGPVCNTHGNDIMNPGYRDVKGSQGDGTDGVSDTILSFGDNSRIHAGSGNDVVFGGTVLGGIGNHLVNRDDGSFGTWGTKGSGQETVIGRAKSDHILASTGDRVTGGKTGRKTGNVTGDDDNLDLAANSSAKTNIRHDAENPENGLVDFLDANGDLIGSLQFSGIEEIIACFTAGTRIAALGGEMAIEDIAKGTKILTRDHGYQTVVWTGSREMNLAELVKNPDLRPVRIAAGALGPNRPQRDMMVSPKHRILFIGPRAEILFGEAEVLILATHLVGQPGITRAVPVSDIASHYILFEEHELVMGDGIWSESFQPGIATLQGLNQAQRQEILSLFPELYRDPSCYQAARITPKRREAEVLFAA